MFDDICEQLFVTLISKNVQSENLKYLKKFEDKHEKLDFRFLPEKCNL